MSPVPDLGTLTLLQPQLLHMFLYPPQLNDTRKVSAWDKVRASVPNSVRRQEAQPQPLKGGSELTRGLAELDKICCFMSSHDIAVAHFRDAQKPDSAPNSELAYGQEASQQEQEDEHTATRSVVSLAFLDFLASLAPETTCKYPPRAPAKTASMQWKDDLTQVNFTIGEWVTPPAMLGTSATAPLAESPSTTASAVEDEREWRPTARVVVVYVDEDVNVDECFSADYDSSGGSGIGDISLAVAQELAQHWPWTECTRTRVLVRPLGAKRFALSVHHPPEVPYPPTCTVG